MEQVGFGDEVYYEVPEDPTNMLEKLDVDKVTNVVVTDSGALLDSDLDADEIKIKSTADTKGTVSSDPYKVVVDADLMSLVGLEVDLWVDGDEVLAIDDTNASDIVEITDDIDNITADGFDVTDEDDDVTSYTLAEGAVVVLNYEKDSITEAKTDDDGVATGIWKMIANDDNEVSYLWIIDYGTPGIVDEVDVNDEVIDFKESSTLDLSEVDDYAVVLNGELADLNDIQEWDLVYEFGSDDDHKRIEVVREAVEGTLERQRDGWDKIYVDGEKYDVASGASFSTDAGDTLGDSTSDLLGEEVKVLLDAEGDAFVVIGDVEATTDLYAVVAEKAAAEGYGDDEAYIRLFTTDGDDVVYKFDEDFWTEDIDVELKTALQEPNNDPDTLVGTLVEVSLNDAGEIDGITTVGTGSINWEDEAYDFTFSGQVDDTNDRLQDTGSGTWYYAADDMVIFHVPFTGGFADDYDKWDVVTWKALEDATTSIDLNGLADKNEDIEYIVVTSGTLGAPAADDYLFVGTFENADGTNVEYFDGTLRTAVMATGASGDPTAIPEYAIVDIDFNSDGEIKSISMKPWAKANVELDDDPVYGSRVEVDGVVYLVDPEDEKTVIFDAVNDELDIIDVSDLAEGDFVSVVDNDDGGVGDQVADYIVRHDKDTDAPSAPTASVSEGTNPDDLDISGVAEANSVVTATVVDWLDNSVTANRMADADDGAYSWVDLDVSTLADGVLTVAVTATDMAGNTSDAATDTSTKEALAPKIVSITGSGTTITVVFGEVVDETSVKTKTNWTYKYDGANPGTISGITYDANTSTATITVQNPVQDNATLTATSSVVDNDDPDTPTPIDTQADTGTYDSTAGTWSID